QVSRRPPSGGRDPGRPAWERSRRNEAYPTLKTRMGMPAIPRVALAVGALVIAAVVIFALPFLLNFGGAPGPTTPPVSVGPSSSGLESTGPSASAPSALATPQTYTVVANDTISKIAKKFGLTVAALEAANPQIKNPNAIKIGDKINIPSATPTDVIDGASPAPSAGPS
ncbi:MAG: LysM peptidoglycan-binding domain-containing protein, partial [Candidatus Limnocylindrales bacterium]